MLLPSTEALRDGVPIDMRSARDAVSFFVDGQIAALEAVRGAAAGISVGARVMAATIQAGGCLHYIAAGSSGLMALADASELSGTFGIPKDSVKIHMAGGVPVDAYMPGATEDDVTASRGIADGFSDGDIAIILSASGSTPFALEVAHLCRAKGVRCVGMANNDGAPLLEIADVAICLATPPEVIAGSTRLGAGTAQKAALNLMSSLMGVELGHVYQGLMVNVVADNAKLVARAGAIVATIAGVPEDAARAALATTSGNAKHAILVAAGADLLAAKELLQTHSGRLGPCLEDLKRT